MGSGPGIVLPALALLELLEKKVGPASKLLMNNLVWNCAAPAGWIALT